MTVTTEHISYGAFRAKWQRCRDAIEGKDAILRHDFECFRFFGPKLKVNLGSIPYLLPNEGMSELDYAKFSIRAPYFNASDRTLNALTGMIFAKDPMWSLPSAIEAFESNITLSGDSLRSFAYHVTEEEITTSRVGVLVDYPQTSPTGLSMAEAQRLNLRPFLRMYKAESIINWRESVINGARVLSMVVLVEEVDTQGGSEFVVDSDKQYRVLDLIDGVYRQRVMNESGELISEVFPTMRGAPMREIPFVIVGGTKCRKPLLMDLVDTSIYHYQQSADRAHIQHKVASATPWVAGAQLKENEVLHIGADTAWVFDNPDVKVGMLEVTGAGIDGIKESINDYKKELAVLGARMLSEDTRGAEAVGTMELRTASERSILAAVARDVSDALRQCLNWMSLWLGAQPVAEFTLNTDYGAHRIDPQHLQQLVAAWQGGAITLRTLFENLQKGEIISPDADYEAYQSELADEGPQIETPIAQPVQDNGVMASLRARLGL